MSLSICKLFGNFRQGNIQQIHTYGSLSWSSEAKYFYMCIKPIFDSHFLIWYSKCNDYGSQWDIINKLLCHVYGITVALILIRDFNVELINACTCVPDIHVTWHVAFVT